MSSYVIVFAAAVTLSLLTSVIWYGKRNIIESAVIGIVWFFCSHIFASFALFLIDWYSLFRTICLTFLLDAAVLGAVVFVRKPTPFSVKALFRCDLSLKPVLIPLCICLLALPFTMQKNEFFGMGQDQGVYQTQALLFLNGDTLRQKDFEEYHLLETAEEQEYYLGRIASKLGGYDILAEDFPDSSYDRSMGKASGIIHGIPTHSAILAMWGELFGMEHMSDVETVFYLCLIFLVFFICRNLRLKPLSCTIAALCTAFAPIVIWVSKSALTEMFLSLLPALFLYFLTDGENRETRWLSILPVAVFGCFHVSFYTMIPLFLMVYGGLYFFTRQRQFAVLMPATVVLYLISFFSMRHIQPQYTLNNYRQVFVGGINVHNITAVVTIVSIAALLICCGYVWVISRGNKKFYTIPNWNRRARESRPFCVFLVLLMAVPVGFIVLRAVLTFDSLGQYNNLTLLGYLANAGILLIPFAMVTAAFRTRYIIHRSRRLVVFLMFFYCILVYAAFLRFEIQYYFYYARYLAPFIPVAAVFAAMMLDRVKKQYVIPAAVLGLCYVTPYDLHLMHNKDDSRLEWEILQDVAEAAEGADCIVIDNALLSVFWMPLDAMTQAHIYPVTDDPEALLSELSVQYGSVMYLTGTVMPEEHYITLCRDINHHSEDDLLSTGILVPMSYAFRHTEELVLLYRFDKYDMRYDVTDAPDTFSGFSQAEGPFIWTAQERTSITCGLVPADYTMTLNLGNAIPLDLLDDGCMEITVSLNDAPIGEIRITEENNNAAAQLLIPEELVMDGENTLTFESELWHASEINPADNRTLGFPLESVVFTPAP